MRRALGLQREASRARGVAGAKGEQINFFILIGFFPHEVCWFGFGFFFSFSLLSVSLLMRVHGPGQLSRLSTSVALKGRGAFSILGLTPSAGFVAASGNIDGVDLCASSSL